MKRGRRLVVATFNPGKQREIAEILAAEGLQVELVSLAEVAGADPPPETGTSFRENALEKALYAARAAGMEAIADDSGLEVDALGGAPGINSARYLGPGARDEDRCRRILELLKDVPLPCRTARFRCAAAFATPRGENIVAEGTCEGHIALAPAGTGGFGYDPIFVPLGRSVTMAQLSPEEKHALSHRGRAFRALARALREQWSRPGSESPDGV